MAQVENAKDSKQVIVNLTMTVEEARQVIWQDLYHPREPIGKLLDSKQLKYGSLCWAVAGAPNQEMRAAARTLLAYWVGEPATLEATRRYGPEVIEGSHFLQDQELDSLMNGTISIGIIMGFIFGGIVASLTLVIVDGHTDLLLPAMLLFVIACLSAVWEFFRQIKPQIFRYKNFRQGREGEDAAVEKLRAVLDNHWTIFRNLHLPDRKDDIDIALIGPGGLWAVEVKAFGGSVRSQNGLWERQTKQGWKKLDQNPSRQATENAKRLNHYLQQQGITRWVEKAVILSEPQAISNFEHAEDVWILPQVEDKAANLSTRTPPTEDEINRIVGLFRELATKQIAAEEAKYKK